MSAATPTNVQLHRPASASGAPTPRPFNVTALEIGLAIGFGPVFLFGVIAWVLDLFGSAAGPRFAGTLLWTQIVSVGALLGFVLLWEKRPLGSLGLRKASYGDVEFGLGLAIVLLVLEIIIGSLVPILYESEVGFISRRLWLPLSSLFTLATQLGRLPGSILLIVAAIGEELAVRGYAFGRFRQLTQSTALAAGLALMIDLLAHAPLWGLDYTICFVPAELILMWFYVSERRLLPCMIGHLGFDLLPIVLLAFHIQIIAPAAPAMNPHAARGIELMENHQYPDAIAEFTRALRENPGDAIAYRGRGGSYAQNGDFERGIKDLDQAIRLDPKRADTYVNRSFAYRSRGDLPHALADMNTAIKLAPDVPNFLSRRGYIYSLMGDHDKAIDDFSAMIALSPTDPEAYEQRAKEYKQKHDYKRALEDADKLVKLKPADAYSYGTRGNLELETHDYDKALADANKMFALDPANVQYGYQVANIYKSLGRFDEELVFCKKLAADHPREVDANLCVADAYYHKSD
jgi:tetratricopeptide (TPR) repeat protein